MLNKFYNELNDISDLIAIPFKYFNSYKFFFVLEKVNDHAPLELKPNPLFFLKNYYSSEINNKFINMSFQ